MQKRFAIAGSFVVALAQPSIVFLLLLFASAVVHAQVCVNVNLNNPLDQTISPNFWAPGHNYNVIFTDPNGEFYATDPAYSPTQIFIFNKSQYTPGWPVYLEDPYVTVSPPTYLSPTQTSFSVSVAAGAPTEGDGLNFTCSQTGFLYGPGFIQITPCAVGVTPTLTPTSVQPGTWTAGVATNITITGTNFIPTSNPNNCFPTSLSITAGTENVSITNPTVVSSTQITATVQPQITDPAETATVTVSNYLYNGNGQTPPSYWASASTTAQIVPTTCPVPHVASVSPNIWFAGNSYRNVTFTGKNFITSSKATKTCPATTLSITTQDGDVTVSGISVSSATKITGTVRVASGASTEGATADAYGDTAPTPDADVLGQPFIKWANDPDGSTPIIGGPYIELSDPSAVVGQQLYLTTTPTAATLAALPTPLTFASTNPTTWTVTGGTNIGGYTPTFGSFATGSVTPMPPLNTPSLTFYSVYPATGVEVTYTYCVSGQTTCPEAPAWFNVTGPTGGTMSFTPFAPAVTIADLTACTDPHGYTWPGGPWMYYATGVTGLACPGEAHYPAFGINFNTPTGYENDSGGSYLLVQLISSDTITGESANTFVAGLDTDYPYGSPPTSDSPKVYLLPTATSVTRNFTANMFLMWQSNTTNAIPVPLGYQTWGFSGTATCSAACGTASNWTAANTPGTTPGPVGDFVPSSASQTEMVGNNTLVDGYPTWTSTSN